MSKMKFIVLLCIGLSLVQCKPFPVGIPALACQGAACDLEDPGLPVCAVDALGQATTFWNMCHLEMISCRDNTIYAVIREGEC